MTTTEAKSREDRRAKARLYQLVREAERQMPEVARQVGRVLTHHVNAVSELSDGARIERDGLLCFRNCLGVLYGAIGAGETMRTVLRYAPNGGTANEFHPGRWLIILDQLALEARQHEEMHLRAERDRVFERFAPVDDAALFPELPAPAWLGDRDGDF